MLFLFQFVQTDRFRTPFVKFIQRETAGNHAVPGRVGAVPESPADMSAVQGFTGKNICTHLRIGKDHTPDPGEVCPAMLDGILRRMGQDKGVVMDGRDIGTSVFPNAELKIFMTASVEVRAQRRFKEIQDAGGKESFDDVLKNLKERDHLDQTREVSPLRKADDALLLDNSNMSIPEQFVWLDRILLERFGLQMK